METASASSASTAREPAIGRAKWASSVQHGQVQMYLIFCLSEYLKILIRYRLPRKVSKIKIKILRPLYLLYLSLQYLRYSPTLSETDAEETKT